MTQASQCSKSNPSWQRQIQTSLLIIRVCFSSDGNVPGTQIRTLQMKPIFPFASSSLCKSAQTVQHISFSENTKSGFFFFFSVL